MATYYKWRKTTRAYSDKQTERTEIQLRLPANQSGMYVMYGSKPSITNSGRYDFSDAVVDGILSGSYSQVYYGNYAAASDNPKIMYTAAFENDRIKVNRNDNIFTLRSYRSEEYFYQYEIISAPGTFQGYVYSISSSAYPNGGVSGNYYYDQRMTIASPTAPNSITYPNSITNQAVSITFTESTSVIPNYSVDEYEISYNVNESSWVVAGTTKELSYSFNIPSVFTSNIMFRVRAKDTNGQWGDYKTGAIASVSLPAPPPPVLTLPSSPVKINESFPINWTSVSEATGYVLQKKRINDSDWSEVYNGILLSYTDTANDLGLRYRISYKLNEFQSNWSQEYSLNTFEKLIEISYLDESGGYVPLYPITSTVAVLNTSDLINLTLSVGTYQGNGFETNSIALENSVDPKIAIITNSKQETTLVTNFNENNMTVKESNNELGETYNYVIIGNNKSK